MFVHRIYEGDLSEITTLDEVHYREHLLEEALKQVRMRKVWLYIHLSLFYYKLITIIN